MVILIFVKGTSMSLF